MSDKITFLATFPTIKSALIVSGDEGGMQVKLEIPEIEMAKAVHLLGVRGKILRVTVELEDERNDSDKVKY